MRVVVTGNLLVVPGRHFFLRHFPAARCHLNVVRAHSARAHKSLLEHGSDHVSDTPEREQTISRLSECGNRPNRRYADVTWHLLPGAGLL